MDFFSDLGVALGWLLPPPDDACGISLPSRRSVSQIASASVTVRGRLYNPGSLNDQIQLSIQVLDANGKEVSSISKNLAPWTGEQELASFNINKPALWSPRSPSLYRCIVTLKSVHGEYDSAYGTVTTDWSRGADGKLSLHVRVPANSTATVYLPAKGASAVTEGGKAVEAQREEDSFVVLIGTGEYEFAMR